MASNLNELGIFKKLRENNVKDSRKKSTTHAKNIFAINENDLFTWDGCLSHLIYYNLKNLESVDRKERVQILQCTDNPKFDVDWLTWNHSRTHLALWGQLGITVLELPQKWGKFAEFQGGKDNVTCKCISLAEHYFMSRQGLKLLQVSWHPGSETDSHVVFLTSDNNLSIYNILTPDHPVQTIHLGDEDHSFGMSLTRPSISTALGEHAVSFDFGTVEEVFCKNRGSPLGMQSVQKEARAVWPVYCVKGNGDVVVAYTDLSPRPVRLGVQGPLLMHPPAEDNYGNDACAILFLPTMPPVIVITTCDGRLYHCVLLPKELEDTTLKSESSFRSTASEPSLYFPPEEKLLYVYESVELELLLTVPKVADTQTDAQTEGDVFTCPIKLVKDTTNPERYHCSHAAGVHTVVLPWISTYQRYVAEDEEEDSLNDQQECVVEHLLCTKPVVTSPPSPILGLSMLKDELLGSTMLTLTSDFEFQRLRLSDMKPVTSSQPLLSSTSGESLPSPLRRISKEAFDDRIRRILRRNTSNPLLKSKSSTELSQQECFELLSRATQVFREEYIQKQDIAWQEISRRVGILREQKEQQKSDLNNLEELRSTLAEGAENLGNECENCKDKQEELLRRIEAIMRKMQSRVPFLSEPERNMKRELESMDEKLETYQRNLEQLKVKSEYQRRQIQHSSKGQQPSPIIKSNQVKQLKDVLKQEGDELDFLMKKITQLKMETTS